MPLINQRIDEHVVTDFCFACFASHFCYEVFNGLHTLLVAAHTHQHRNSNSLIISILCICLEMDAYLQRGGLVCF